MSRPRKNRAPELLDLIGTNPLDLEPTKENVARIRTALAKLENTVATWCLIRDAWETKLGLAPAPVQSMPSPGRAASFAPSTIIRNPRVKRRPKVMTPT